MKRRFLLAATLAAVLAASPALAVMPDEQLPDTVLETRAVDISRELRCVVCQNQSIDDSAAPLARDMRIIVRERLVAGDTDAEVKAFLVARYGNYVLLRPPLQGDTWALWFAPFAVFLLAVAGVFGFAKSRSLTAPAPLSDADREKLERLRRARAETRSL